MIRIYTFPYAVICNNYNSMLEGQHILQLQFPPETLVLQCQLPSVTLLRDSRNLEDIRSSRRYQVNLDIHVLDANDTVWHFVVCFCYKCFFFLCFPFSCLIAIARSSCLILYIPYILISIFIDLKILNCLLICLSVTVCLKCC